MSKKLIVMLLAAAIGVLVILGLNTLNFSFPGLVSYAIVGFVSAGVAVLLTPRR